MITRHTSLSENIVQFCRFLRHRGFALSVEDEATALDAMQFVDYTQQVIFKLALKTVFCKSKNEIVQFDDLFTKYWRELRKAVDSKIKTEVEPSLKQTTKDASFKSLKSWLNANQNKEIEQLAAYSISENLSQKDFSKVPPEELEELKQSIKAMSRRLAANLNRRYEKKRKINLPDLRKTLRKNMRYGGELIDIVFKKPKRNRTKLVVFCDVSKSMDLYAAFFLQFMYAFQQVFSRMETFTFSTSLQCITSVLKQNNFDAALNLLSKESNSWSGGTRIGESLDRFVKDYASRVLDNRTTVIILSDGLDTGEIPLLKQTMELIHSRSKKVIWLNPLAGYASYRPDVAGMKAALPYVDLFAAIYNLNSLKMLGRWL